MLYIKDTSMLVAGVAVPGLVKKLEITGAAATSPMGTNR